jgi:tetratricopeptide (TPR) repeat protein
LYSVRATVQHRLGRNDEAVADLNRAIELNGKEARFHNNRGFVLLGMQQFEGALKDLNRATELEPRYPNAFNNRGLLYIAQSRYSEAIEQLDQALKFDPNYVDAYNNRGFAALQAGHLEMALADFNTAMKINPKYVSAYNNRGLLRARAGDLENAALDFTEAMMLDPLNPKYYQHRRAVYLRLSAFDKAGADEQKYVWLEQLGRLNTLATKNPGDVHLLVQRARHHLKVEDDERALRDLDQALSINSRSASALVTRAGIRARWKEYLQALSDAEAALAIEPSQEAFSARGDACLGLKEYDRAIESFAQARRFDPAVAEAYYRKSQILRTSGESEQAAETLQHALALDPDIQDRLR